MPLTSCNTVNHLHNADDGWQAMCEEARDILMNK